mgnify:CR=1 FL=1
MTTIASFHTFNFDSSEITALAGSIRYPYQKIDKIRNYTTLQIASKSRETIVISATFENETRFTALNNLALSRIKGDFYVGTKYWGKFAISSVDRQIDSLGRSRARIEFTQTTPTTAIGDFTPIASAIGNYGLFDFAKEEFLDLMQEALTYPTDEIARLQNFPKVQDGEDDLIQITLRLRFSKVYNTNPQQRLDTLRTLADNYTFYTLTIKGTNYGDYVIQSIRWSQTDTLNVTAEFLQSPTGLPPKEPIISSFVVNSVQKVTTLAPNVTSLSYTETITGGASILEIEFDAQATDIPVEGDSIEVKFKYEGDSSEFNTGTHKCDYPERNYAPDTVRVGAQSYDYNLSLNSQEKITYTNQQLNLIVSQIASNFSLTLIGNISTIIAGTAPNTTDLPKVTSNNGYAALLDALAKDYGYAFRFKFGNLYFEDFSDLEAAASAGILSPTDCISARFTQKVKGTYRQAFALYDSGNGTVNDTDIPNNDYLDLRQEGYYASLNSALRRSSGALKETNRFRHTGIINIEGDYDYSAKNNLTLFSFDNANDNGKFQIEKVTHRLSATSGWTCELEIRKVS